MPLAVAVGALLYVVLFALPLAQTFSIVSFGVSTVFAYAAVFLGQNLHDNSLACQFAILNMGENSFERVSGWW